MKTKTSKNKEARKVNGGSRSLHRAGRRRRGADEKALKEAWMAGAASGTEVAFSLIMGKLEAMMRELGVERREPPTVEVSHGDRERQPDTHSTSKQP